MSRLRLPAYGRELADAQRRGLNVPELVIALSWSLGKLFPRVVVTDEHAIDELDLSIVKGLPCVVAQEATMLARLPSPRLHCDAARLLVLSST
jgi:hypothetical protein